MTFFFVFISLNILVLQCTQVVLYTKQALLYTTVLHIDPLKQETNPFKLYNVSAV